MAFHFETLMLVSAVGSDDRLVCKNVHYMDVYYDKNLCYH